MSEEDVPPQYAAYPRPSDPRIYQGPPAFRVEAISEARLILQSDMATWVVAYLVIIFITFLVQLPVIVYSVIAGTQNPRAMGSPPIVVLSVVTGLLSVGVTGILQGGFFRIILSRMRLSYEGIMDIFRVDGQGWKLFGWAILLAIPNEVASVIYTLGGTPAGATPGNPFAGFNELLIFMGAMLVVAWLLFPFFLTPVIIVDRKLPMFEAAALSWRTVTKDYGRALAFYFCTSVVSVLGAILCGVGLLFTLPLFFISIAIAYRDHFMPPIQPGNFEGPNAPYDATAH